MVDAARAAGTAHVHQVNVITGRGRSVLDGSLRLRDSGADDSVARHDRDAVVSDTFRHGRAGFDLDVWTDSANRPVRTGYTLESPNPNNHSSYQQATVTTDYTAWAAPVTVAAPANSQPLPKP